MGLKLRFLLIYENMLKRIAAARSECTEKKKKTRRATTQTTLFLI